jgi:hypothetical protein
MPRVSRTGKIAAITVAGVAAIGGLGVAGALPSVGDLSGGNSHVSTVPPEQASETGVEHANAGGGAADVEAPDTEAPETPDPNAPDSQGAGSRLDGLTNAAGNIPADGTASAVINTLITTEPGPGLGAAVSTVASDGHANVPTDVPPVSLPDQASNGQSHRP